jgi:hypothetical protein
MKIVVIFLVLPKLLEGLRSDSAFPGLIKQHVRTWVHPIIHLKRDWWFGSGLKSDNYSLLLFFQHFDLVDGARVVARRDSLK